MNYVFYAKRKLVKIYLNTKYKINNSGHVDNNFYQVNNVKIYETVYHIENSQ